MGSLEKTEAEVSVQQVEIAGEVLISCSSPELAFRSAQGVMLSTDEERARKTQSDSKTLPRQELRKACVAKD